MSLKIKLKNFVPTRSYRTGSPLFKVEISFNEKFLIVGKAIRLAQVNTRAKNFLEANRFINDFIKNLHAEIVAGASETDKIFCSIHHPALDIPIGIRYMLRDEFTPELLADEIMTVCQSKKTLYCDENLEILSQISHTISGAGISTIDLTTKRRCLVHLPVDKDGFCAIRAVLIGKHLADNLRLVNCVM